MKVEVDEDVCVGSMVCEDVCPEVFQVVEGLSRVKVDEVPTELEGKVREAVDGCPVGAIRIVEQ
jgi:ferredoxin